MEPSSMQDLERVDEYIKILIDRFEAPELVERLGLTVQDIIGAFYDEVLSAHIELRE